MPPIDPSRILLTTADLADLLGIAEITARKWRISGDGPPFVRCGRSIRYRAADLDLWVASRTVLNTSQEGAQ